MDRGGNLPHFKHSFIYSVYNLENRFNWAYFSFNPKLNIQAEQFPKITCQYERLFFDHQFDGFLTYDW